MASNEIQMKEYRIKVPDYEVMTNDQIFSKVFEVISKLEYTMENFTSKRTYAMASLWTNLHFLTVEFKKRFPETVEEIDFEAELETLINKTVSNDKSSR